MSLSESVLLSSVTPSGQRRAHQPYYYNYRSKLAQLFIPIHIRVTRNLRRPRSFPHEARTTYGNARMSYLSRRSWCGSRRRCQY